jgi:hypothetical protein
MFDQCFLPSAIKTASRLPLPTHERCRLDVEVKLSQPPNEQPAARMFELRPEYPRQRSELRKSLKLFGDGASMDSCKRARCMFGACRPIQKPCPNAAPAHRRHSSAYLHQRALWRRPTHVGSLAGPAACLQPHMGVGRRSAGSAKGRDRSKAARGYRDFVGPASDCEARDRSRRDLAAVAEERRRRIALCDCSCCQ